MDPLQLPPGYRPCNVKAGSSFLRSCAERLFQRGLGRRSKAPRQSRSTPAGSRPGGAPDLVGSAGVYSRAAAVLALAALAVSPACRFERKPATTAAPFHLYRFDDQLASAATIQASGSGSSLRMAEPIVWDFSEPKTDWILLRGRLGFRHGELAVQGRGSTPVIQSPPQAEIDWSRYQAVEIRMITEAGREIKIKIGDREYKQKLAPPLQYRVYRFNLDITEHTHAWPLAIMPTDDVIATVAIDYVRLVPRMTPFPKAVGCMRVGKGEEYRNTIYTHAPSSLTYEVRIPSGARLHFGIGVADPEPVTFRVLAGADEVYSRTLKDPNTWVDAAVDLTPYEGTSTKIVFRTESPREGAIGFWANPLLAPARPRGRFNILMYTVCTLRPDHTSLYGYERDTTPFLKRLGASGVVFDDCQAQATWTKASVASLLTSLYSYTHGIRRDTGAIPAGAATMAEQFRKAGYVTASITGNPFAGRLTGLDRGFDYQMEYPAVERELSASDRATDSAGLNRVAFRWLDKHRQTPFFLFLLSTDPHAPYRPPAAFERLFANPAETAEFDRDYARLKKYRGYGGGAMISPAECRANGVDPETFRRRAIERYDAEIAHNDHSIELLFNRLEQLKLLENTLVVVLSDHGEEFWEHGWSAHEHSLYDELTHVVLLFWNPRLLGPARRIPDPVQLIDVMPTVAALLSAPLQGVVQGENLLPLLRGEPFHRRAPVMSSRFAHPNFRPDGVPENRTGTFARIGADWKFLYRDQARRAGLKRIELYDHRNDRQDRRDVASEHPELTRKLLDELLRWIDDQKQVRKALGAPGKRKLDPRTLKRLRTLGYLK